MLTHLQGKQHLCFLLLLRQDKHEHHAELFISALPSPPWFIKISETLFKGTTESQIKQPLSLPITEYFPSIELPCLSSLTHLNCRINNTCDTNPVLLVTSHMPGLSSWETTNNEWLMPALQHFWVKNITSAEAGQAELKGAVFSA